MRIFSGIILVAALLSSLDSNLAVGQGRGRGAGGIGSEGGGGLDGARGNFGGEFGGSSAMNDGFDRSSFGGGIAAGFHDAPPVNFDRPPFPVASSPARDERPAHNAERILQHRTDVADHLRANADRHGNEQLSGTADRMDGSAQQNYNRRSGSESLDSGNESASARRPDWATRSDAALSQAASRPAPEANRRWRPGSGLRRLWPFGNR